MSHSESLRTTIGVQNALAWRTIIYIPDTLVDPDSITTWIPRPILESLGIATEQRRAFTSADGRRFERDVGYGILHVEGRSCIDNVVFAEEGDLAVLGERALVGLRLGVDPVKKQLVDRGPILAVAAA